MILLAIFFETCYFAVCLALITESSPQNNPIHGRERLTGASKAQVVNQYLHILANYANLTVEVTPYHEYHPRESKKPD